MKRHTDSIENDHIRNSENHWADYVNFSETVADGIVATKTGDYVASWILEGNTEFAVSDVISMLRVESVSMLFRSCADGCHSFWGHRIRLETEARTSLPKEPFSSELVSAYQDDLNRRGLYRIEHYLTVIYRPPQPHLSGIFKRIQTREDLLARQNNVLKQFSEIVDQLQSLLVDFRPRRLGNYEEGGQRYSKQLEFYAFLINGLWQKIPVKDIPLYRYLPNSRVFVGHEFIEIRTPSKTTYSTFLDLKDFDNFTYPGILSGVSRLNGEFVETQSFCTLSREQALKTIDLRLKRMWAADEVAVTLRDELNFLLNGIAGGEYCVGEYHYTLNLKGDSIQAASKLRMQATEALQNSGFLPVTIDLIPDHALFAQLPGNFKHRPRISYLTSKNFGGLFPLTSPSQGKAEHNPWGSAVALMETSGGEPYYFNFHESPLHEHNEGSPALGNTQIIGQSGGGKTTLALYLIANLQRFNCRCVYFDKDRGAELGIRAMGGMYFRLRKSKKTGLNPFKMNPTPETLVFWSNLIRHCAASGGYRVTPEDETDIANAVHGVSTLPREVRSFDAVIQNLPGAHNGSVASHLLRWADESRLGWLLNDHDDSLDFSASALIGIDYTEILDDAEASSALMLYLLFKMEQTLDGRRFAYFIDEYWKALSAPCFEEFAKNKQKTIRKQNGFGVFMTQSPSDAIQSPIAKTLIEQTATFIYLPNPSGREDEYVDHLRLTGEEFSLFRRMTSKSHSFIVKQSNHSAVVRFSLKGLDRELRILSATNATLNRMDRLIAEHGEDPNNWLDQI